jgi:hypothetical protein
MECLVAFRSLQAAGPYHPNEKKRKGQPTSFVPFEKKKKSQILCFIYFYCYPPFLFRQEKEKNFIARPV